MTFVLPCIWFFLLGSAVGSFLNVLIDRLPEGRDPVFTRSSCSECGTKLKWTDLIPIGSYVFLGGKCRYCGAKLSLWYPVSEITVGLAFSLAFWLYSMNGNLVILLGNLFLWSILFVVAGIDWKTGMIMDVFPALIAAGGIVNGLLLHRPLLSILLGGLVGAGCYGVLYLGCRLCLKREGLGLGDVFLLGAIGFWCPWTQIVVTAFLTAYVSLFFILFKALKEKKIGMKTEFPLGPALCIAAFLMSVCGERVIALLSGILL